MINYNQCPSGVTGIRVRLKIACPLDLWVQLPPRAQKNDLLFRVSRFNFRNLFRPSVLGL